MNGFACDFVCLPEGQSLFDKVIGQICRIGKILTDSLAHIVLVDFHPAHHLGINSQTELHGINGIKQAFLIFLQILVICQRQSFGRCQHGHQMTDNTTGFTANKLRYIRVLLLRHHARTGTVSIIQFNKGKLPGTPENNFFAEAAQMHHQDRGRRQKLKNIITITNRIETVRVNRLKIQLSRHILPINRESRPCQCARSERHDIRPLIAALQSVKIASQHRKIGHHMMRKQDWLGPLQMRIPRHDNITVFFRCFH